MPRRIPAETIAILEANRTGLEPVNIVSIQWIIGGGFFSYSDRLVPGVVPGKLIDIAGMEAVLDISRGGTSTSVKVILDDTDGTIKKLYDSHDFYGRRAIIYQWFTQIPIGDAFPVFEGVIGSPIIWNEGDRTFSFDVVTKIDDVEVGFIVEDGNFTNVPPIIFNKLWPLVFGTVLDMPCVQMDEIPVGTTTSPLGIPDANLAAQFAYNQSKVSGQAGRATCLSLRAAEMMQQGVTNNDKSLIAKGRALENQAFSQMAQVNGVNGPHNARLIQIMADQQKYDSRSFHVINGHRFHQGVALEIIINGASYWGTFNGDFFNVISRMSPNENYHRAPGGGLAPSFPARFGAPVTGTQEAADLQAANRGGPSFKVNLSTVDQSETAAYWGCQPPFFMTFNTLASAPANTIGGRNKQKFWFAQAGASVRPGVGYTIRYIITTMPGARLLYLAAKDKDSGLELITAIPPQYYEISFMHIGGFVAMIATFEQPLSTIWDQHWGNEVYATIQSPIGPNTVDILIWLIQNYTIYGIDFTTFNHVRTLVANYPSNFPILDKRNIVPLLKDIAWQARCALWVTNNIWYIKYLPEQGTPVDTITEDDIEVTTFSLESTPTEELVTKFVATYRESLAIPSPVEICLQSNIAKYGVIEKRFDFWIYNQQQYVLKSATYWTIQYSNVWKVMKCKTFIDKLTIETLDNVTVNLQHPWVANTSVVGTARKATFNSDDFSIDLDIWLPVRLGEMTAYPLAYPAGISTAFVFPDIQQVPGVFVQKPIVDLGASLDAVTPTWAVSGVFGIPVSDLVDITPSSTLPPLLAVMPSIPFVDGGTGAPIPNSAPPIPRYDYDFRELVVPPATAETVGAPATMPATITDDNGDGTYQADVLTGGEEDEEPDNVTVIVPGINKDASLPVGTEGTVTRQVSTRGGTITVSYIFVASPFWIEDESEDD